MDKHGTGPDPRRRPHSVKVPRLYKTAAGILRDLIGGSGAAVGVRRSPGKGPLQFQGGLKNLVFSSGHPNVKALYKLCLECLKRRETISEMLEAAPDLALAASDSRGLDPWLARVLVTELIWGKGRLPGQSRPVLAVLAAENGFKAVLDRKLLDVGQSNLNQSSEGSSAKEDDGPPSFVKRVRFVRINGLKVPGPQRLLSTLRAQGYIQVDPPQVASDLEADFVRMAPELKERQYMKDPLLENLLAFAPGTTFYDHPMYLDGSLILQDRASCLTVEALEIPPGAVVLDACAAPGMKTLQALEKVNLGDFEGGLNGSVISVERDAKRFNTMLSMVPKHLPAKPAFRKGAGKKWQPINRDFLKLEPSDYPEVEYIILDPSCSGSGISTPDRALDGAAASSTKSAAVQERLQKLAQVQSRMLLHALKFPNVKRVAYSTCSVNREENEEVVLSALGNCPDFRLKDNCLPQWKTRGLKHLPEGHHFIRSYPEINLGNGFFVAVLEKRSLNLK